MIVIGSHGMGKMTLVNSITKTVEAEVTSHLLCKTVMSGVIANLMGVTTLHWCGGLPPKKIPDGEDWMDHSSKELKKRQEENIGSTLTLVIDKISMLMTTVLALILQVAGRVYNVDSTMPLRD